VTVKAVLIGRDLHDCQPHSAGRVSITLMSRIFGEGIPRVADATRAPALSAAAR
jgi:hypothetical protein